MSNSQEKHKKYGYLPPKVVEVEPWRRVNVDLIGPYSVKTPTKKHSFRAMTMIDPATNWFKIAVIHDPNSKEMQCNLDSFWLARYPRPQECGFDSGSEFKWLFKALCTNFGFKSKNTMDYNPQANAIIERVHQVIGDQMRTFELENREFTKVEKTFELFLTACAYAIRSTFHTTYKASPGQLVLVET